MATKRELELALAKALGVIEGVRLVLSHGREENDVDGTVLPVAEELEDDEARRGKVGFR